MILLLSYKGAEPISYINRNLSFYGTVFTAMVAFGAIEQLLLCRFAKGKAKRAEKANKSEQKSKKESSSWRRN